METGERPVVETFEEMSSLMIETYKLCKTYTEGKEVLDVGCDELVPHNLCAICKYYNN